MICVTITTHQAYLDYLPPAIAAVNGQTLAPGQKIIAYDGSKTDLKGKVPDDWTIVTARKKGSPNHVRNAALNKCNQPWIIYADGDDVMDLTYVEDCMKAVKAADHQIGVIYSDIEYSSGQRLVTPDWERNGYWRLRQKNFISSTSCWKVEAIKRIGWSDVTECYDDYSLALDVTAAEWHGMKGPGVIRVQDHGDGHRRNKDGKRVFPHIWNHRSYTMITLMAGRTALLENWANWLKNAELPPNFKAWVVDDSRNDKFRKALMDAIDGIEVPVAVVPVPAFLEYEREETTWARDRGPAHRHVARMYDHFVRECETDFLLMFEDDMVPPLDGLKRLAEHWDYLKRPAGIGGVYLSRQNGRDRSQGIVVASNHERFWRCDVKLAHVKGLKQFNQIAGGFTLWNNGMLRDVDCIEYGQLPYGGRMFGWDTDLSLKLGNLGWKLYLADDVYCEHRYEVN